MKPILSVFLIIQMCLAVTHEEILNISIPSIDNFIVNVERRSQRDFLSDLFQVVRASASFAPRYTFTNFDRDPSAPYFTFNLGVDLGKMLSVPNERYDAIQESKGKVTKVYGEITKGIESGRKILLRIDTYDDLRTNTTDFEKRMLYSDKIYELEKELVGLYERLIGLQIDLYLTAGVGVKMEGAVFDYSVKTLRVIFREEAGRGGSYMYRPLRYR